MTTIAITRKAVAADTLCSFGDGTPSYHSVKIFKQGDDIYGAAGSCAATTQFYEWFRRGCPPMENPALPSDGDAESKDGFIGFVANEEGIFIYNALCDPDKLLNEFYAIGTGGSYAMVELAQGKSPTLAVLRACEFDEASKCWQGKPTLLQVRPRVVKTKLKYQKPTPTEASADKPTEAADSGQVPGS